MRDISPALQTKLDQGLYCHWALITRKDGTTHGYTDHEFPLVLEGITYQPSPGMSTLRRVETANSQVDTQELSSVWVEVPDDDLLAGRFDSATLETGLASWEDTSLGRFVVYKGELGEISWTEEGWKAEITSVWKNMQKNYGVQYTASCRHTLYSSSLEAGKIGYCGVNPATFSSTGSIQSVITPKWKFDVGSTGKPEGYFTNGTITFTSGTSNGLTYHVKNHTGNTITLALATAFVIPAGTTFVLRAGCDKTFETCKNKFNNVINYGGFPHIQPDVTYRTT